MDNKKAVKYAINKASKSINESYEKYQVPFSVQTNATPTDLVMEIVAKMKGLNGKDVLIIANYDVAVLLYALKVMYGKQKLGNDYNFKSLTLLTDIAEIDPKFEDKFEVVLANLNEPAKIDMMGKKFDLVIGNPPYNATGSTPGANHLWPQFVVFAQNISKRFYLLITPKKWTGFSTNIKKGKVSLYRDLFRGNLVYANIGECSRHFTVGNSKDSFSYYLIDKNGVEESTIKTIDGTYTYNTNKIEYMPTEILGEESFSIIDKFFNNDFKRYKFLSKYYISKTGTSKLIINSAQRCWLDKLPMFMDNNESEELQPTTKCYQTREELPVGSTDEAVNALLRSKLYTFMHKTYYDGDCFTVGHWDKMPFISTTEVLTDEEIYKAFDLSKEEIKLIETVIDNA